MDVPPHSSQLTDWHPRVVVANRLPVRWHPEEGWRRSPGGLVTALAGLRGDATWVGAASGPLERLPADTRRNLVPVPFSAEESRNYYDGFSNRTLWPALHGMSAQVEQLEDWWRGYVRANERVAKLVALRAPIGARVWVHDYHFMCLPALLRRLRDDLAVGVFLHTPFDPALGDVAHSAQLAAGLSAAHLIGVQRPADAARLAAWLDSFGSRPPVEAHPVALDAAVLRRLRNDPVANASCARLRLRAGSRQVIVGVDRLDYTKGVFERLLAFEALLDTGVVSPEQVVLHQVAHPSRVAVPAYRRLREEVVAAAKRINHRFGAAHRPVVELELSTLSPREVAGVMRAADVAAMVPVRDGMNLVAKEFCVVNEDRPAALVLSRTAGAYDELEQCCIGVDGANVTSIAAGLRDALSLDAASRLEMMRCASAVVSARTSGTWAEGFLTRLDLAAELAEPLGPTGARPAPV